MLIRKNHLARAGTPTADQILPFGVDAENVKSATGLDLRRGATFSDCGKYRYLLSRHWAEGPCALFCMLNPSTASELIDDPTIRKCMGFSRKWGMAGMYVVNLFAWRATDPKELLKTSDPIGPDNKWAIRQAVELCKGPIVAAWGANKAIERFGFRKTLCSITDHGLTVNCLGTTQEGHPRHPLYVPYAKPLDVFAKSEVQS